MSALELEERRGPAAMEQVRDLFQACGVAIKERSGISWNQPHMWWSWGWPCGAGAGRWLLGPPAPQGLRLLLEGFPETCGPQAQVEVGR